LNDGVGAFLSGQAHLRAALRVFAWGGQAQAVPCAALFYQPEIKYLSFIFEFPYYYWISRFVYYLVLAKMMAYLLV
jgi:hypothetical protein